MKKPTKKQIEEQIKLLAEMKPRVMRRSGFGDDHHAAIDAQLVVLRERLTEDGVYDRFPCREESDSEDAVPMNVYESALEAAQWLQGESEYKTIIENWAGLCREQVAPVRRIP